MMQQQALASASAADAPQHAPAAPAYSWPPRVPGQPVLHPVLSPVPQPLPAVPASTSGLPLLRPVAAASAVAAPASHESVSGVSGAPMLLPAARRPGTGNSRKRKRRFVCDTCDKSFSGECSFNNHIKSHVKCKHCDFTALTQLVREHTRKEHAGEGKARRRHPATPGNKRARTQSTAATATATATATASPAIASAATAATDSRALPSSLVHIASYHATDSEPEELPTGHQGSPDAPAHGSVDDIDADEPADALQRRTSASSRRCRFFARGSCRNGEACRYRHVKPAAGSRRPHRASAAAGKAAASSQLPSLLARLEKPDVQQRNALLLAWMQLLVKHEFDVPRMVQERQQR